MKCGEQMGAALESIQAAGSHFLLIDPFIIPMADVSTVTILDSKINTKRKADVNRQTLSPSIGVPKRGVCG
jgi:hypothetical protein